MTAPEPGVYISPAQSYQEVRALTEAVARIETKVDNFLRDAKDIRRDVHDHETRIRALEHRVWTASGAAAVVGTAAGYLLQFLAQ